MINVDIKNNIKNLKNLLKDFNYCNDINNNKLFSSYINKINHKLICKKKSLKNIKSTFFIRILFSYLVEKTKLQAIKYNKDLQDLMDIKLINYKFFSNKYII